MYEWNRNHLSSLSLKKTEKKIKQICQKARPINIKNNLNKDNIFQLSYFLSVYELKNKTFHNLEKSATTTNNLQETDNRKYFLLKLEKKGKEHLILSYIFKKTYYICLEFDA